MPTRNLLEGESFLVLDELGFITDDEVTVVTEPVRVSDEEGIFFEVQGDDGELYDVRWSGVDDCWVGEVALEDEGEDEIDDFDAEEEYL